MNAVAFKQQLRSFQELHNIPSVNKLAKELKEHQGVINAWMNGSRNPQPGKMKTVLNKMKKYDEQNGKKSFWDQVEKVEFTVNGTKVTVEGNVQEFLSNLS